MLTETELTEKLQAFAQNEFSVSKNDDLSEIIPAMLKYIGTPDGYLRDELIYSAFATWILHADAIDHAQLRSMLPIVLDEQHLLYGLGEQDTDSVFTRAFSVLLLPLLLMTHRAHPFLSAAEIGQIKEKLLYYLRNEKDRRGFVCEKGWAHATAHAADALEDLAQCSELNKSDLLEILEVIYDMVCVKEMGYTHLEEERIVTAALAILDRQLLSEAEIAQWIEGFADRTRSIVKGPERSVIRANVKNFLQSLYFRLEWEQRLAPFRPAIDRTLQGISLFKKPAAN